MISFSFGKNWLRYVKFVLNEDIIISAKNSLIKFIPKSDFKDKIFVDIGCGSGLFSLCALRLGAKKVISFDVDLKSLEATRLCKEKFALDNANWEIFHGSILDNDFLNNLKLILRGGVEDEIIFYSWGVLHHTGDLKSSMKNLANLAKIGKNIVFISIYNKTKASEFWLKVKQFYNDRNFVMKFFIVSLYFAFLTFEDLRKGRGLNLYDKTRGMYKITDIIDWLGGLPYEPMNDKEVKEIWDLEGFKCTKFQPTKFYEPIYPKNVCYKYFVYFKSVGLGCNEFIFKTKDV